MCARYRAEHRPIFAISGHIGNFELLAAYHAKFGMRVTVIGREPNYSFVSAFVDRLRANYQAESLWRHGKVVASGVLRALKTGRSLAVLLDQDTALASAYAPFFGIPAASPRAPIDLAIRQKLPIITSFIVREGPERHHVISEPVEYDPTDPQAAEKILAVFNRRLEDLIVRYPEQWIWWHRRWRRRPDVDYEKEPSRLLNVEQYIHWISSQAQQA